jgi:CBS domain-containing protein
MTTVREILKAKGSETWTITPKQTVFDALVTMADKNVGAVVVVNENAVVGIFSERDYARQVALKGKSSREIRVEEIMTSNPVTVSPDHSIEDCMELMNERHIRHLPVMENQKLAGMITIRDVIKAVLVEKEHTIKQLENYIKGT